MLKTFNDVKRVLNVSLLNIIDDLWRIHMRIVGWGYGSQENYFWNEKYGLKGNHKRHRDEMSVLRISHKCIWNSVPSGLVNSLKVGREMTVCETEWTGSSTQVISLGWQDFIQRMMSERSTLGLLKRRRNSITKQCFNSDSAISATQLLIERDERMYNNGMSSRTTHHRSWCPASQWNFHWKNII